MSFSINDEQELKEAKRKLGMLQKGLEARSKLSERLDAINRKDVQSLIDEIQEAIKKYEGN